MKRLHPWMECVYQHMLRSGERMSCKDAARFFGDPQGTTAAKLMHSALRTGYFTAVDVGYEGRDGHATIMVFTAVRRQGISETGLQVQRPASSVWQLAEVML